MSDWIREFACLWENGESVEEEENDLGFGCAMEWWVPGEKQDDANHIKTAQGYSSCLPVEYNKENPSGNKPHRTTGLHCTHKILLPKPTIFEQKTGIFVAVS